MNEQPEVLILTPVKDAGSEENVREYFARLQPLTRSDILLPEEAGEIETEGLGILASDMEIQCWGLSGLEIIHANL